LTLDLPEPSLFTLVGLQEDLSTGQRVESFAVDAWDGNAWRQIANGTTIGYKRLLRVERTQAQRVRLRILAARLEPAIAAIHLFLD